jgi:hypothetical protein
MSSPGSRQKQSFTKVAPRARVSPDDVRWQEIERDRLAASDTRTPAQKWLGDPEPNRSALAQKSK